MRNSILKFAATVIIGTAVLTASAHPSNKEVQKSLVRPVALQQDANSDYQKMKKEWNESIKKNEEDIAKLKAKEANKDKEIQAKYNKKVAEVERKNKELKKKLDTYKESDKGKWAEFKQDFGKSMNELGTSIKDLFVSK
jgi:chromosome segregation ATPase